MARPPLHLGHDDDDEPVPDGPDPALVEFAGLVFEACARNPDQRSRAIAKDVCVACAKYGVDLGMTDADFALRDLGLAREAHDPDEGCVVWVYWGEKKFGKLKNE